MSIDTVDWKITGKCNLRCLHCYGPPKDQGALPFDKLLKLIERFTELGVQRVVLTGGEPLLVPNIGYLMRLLHERGITIALSTNTSFFESHRDDIERYVSSLNIPLDGSSARIHAQSRADQRTFYSCLEVLHYYRSNPARRLPMLRVGTVYSSATAGDFLSIAAVLEPFANIITTWKIYELIDYEFQPERRKPIKHDASGFEKEMVHLLQNTSFSSNIAIASASSRDRAYFMINPKGQLVLPTEIEGVGREVCLGNFLEDPLETLLRRWCADADVRNYYGNHGQSYAT